jgi:O-antigen ligase
VRATPRIGDSLFGVAALVAAAACFAAVQTLVAYRAGPTVAVVLPLAAAATVVIAVRPVLGVYATLLAIPLERLAISAGPGGLSPAEALGVLTAAIATVRFVIAGGAHLTRAHAAFALFLLASATGFLFAPDTTVVAKLTLMWLAALGLSVVVASSTPREIIGILTCLGIAGGVVGVIAMTTTGEQQLIQGGAAATGRAEASFNHPAVLGFFLVLAFGPALVLALRGRVTIRPVMALATVTILAGLALSLTRGALVGAAVTLLVLLALPAFRRAAIAILLVLGLFAAFNFQTLERSREVSVVSKRLATITQVQPSSSNQRLRIWSIAPSIVADNPFLGVGAGNFSQVAPSYHLVDFSGLPFLHAHDLLLTIAAERGLIGLALFVWFMVELGRAASVAMRSRDSSRFPLALGVLAALAGLFTTAIADYPPGTNVIILTIMIEAGVLLALARHERDAAAT